MDEIYDQIEFNEVDRVKKVRKKKNYPLRILIFLGVIIGVVLIMSSSLFDIKNIEVEGNSYYSDDEVINIAGAKTGGNIFWGIGKGDIEKNLLEDPYFTEVNIKRKLPGTAVIEVTERKQIAAVVYGDKYIVIDSGGTILRKSKEDPKITLIQGLTISKMNTGEAIKVEESANLDMTLEMLKAMEKGDMFFKKIDMSRVTIRAYIYDTLIVKGTPKQIIKSIKSGELQKVVNNIIKSGMKRGTISIGNHNYMSFSPVF